MAVTTRDKVPFAAGPRIDDPHSWGVWDRRQKCWALRPAFADEGAERIAAIMVEAHAAGATEGEAIDGTPHRGLPFGIGRHPTDPETWSVWDRRHDCRLELLNYCQAWAERVSTSLNEAYAAGLAEAMIEKARKRGPLEPTC